jgi:hypothetical protein
MLTHGVVALEQLFPEERTDGGPLSPRFVFDSLDGITVQRDSVRWHLLSIARLSLGLGGNPVGEEEPAWDPTWAAPVIRGEDEYLWTGAPIDREGHIFDAVTLHERWQDVPPDLLPGIERVGGVDAWLTVDSWWPRVRGRLGACREGARACRLGAAGRLAPIMARHVPPG